MNDILFQTQEGVEILIEFRDGTIEAVATMPMTDCYAVRWLANYSVQEGRAEVQSYGETLRSKPTVLIREESRECESWVKNPEQYFTLFETRAREHLLNN